MTIRGVPDLNDLRDQLVATDDKIVELSRQFLAIRQENLDPDHVNAEEVVRLTRRAGVLLRELWRLTLLVWQAAELERAARLEEDFNLTEEEAGEITRRMLRGLRDDPEIIINPDLFLAIAPIPTA